MRKSLPMPFLCALCLLAGCHLVDQRDFDARAGRRPVPPATVAAAPPRVAPALVTIRYDRPDPPYREAVAEAVQRALARKRDVLFTVTSLVPPTVALAAQLAAEEAAAARGRDVAAAIVQAGADPGQVEQAVAQDPAVTVREVRVTVH